ncbi:MAG: hypothetical protein A3I72_10545 [Candidatus Tectomicrobia bacterium RIFCSPLOWO2_02_FULL_70_19]|nr:MAG: hypothetical protein A3I72_10545 [Candidatus Tectomicrobia bacterium RIFCSPLOWO2_02_FULL_70_19]
MLGDTTQPNEEAISAIRLGRWKLARLRPFVVSVLSLAGFALLWEVFSRSGAVNPLLVPPPSEVFRTIVEQIGPGSGERPSYLMLRHTGATVLLLLAGYFIAAVAATVLGLLMGMNRHLYEWCNPLISFFMPIPTITLVPVAILWFGLGAYTVVFIVIIGSYFPIVYNAAAGVRSTPQKYIWAARITGASKTQIFFKVLLPSTMSYIIAGQKLALGRAWRAVISGEIFASTQYGLGFMIFDARTFLDTETVFAGIVIVGIVGLVLEKIIFRCIERLTVDRWGTATAKTI